MVKTKSQVVSLEPDVLEVGFSEKECSLLGDRCRLCDLAFFPRRRFCVRCCGPELEEIRLSRRGRLKSFTLVHQRPKHAVIEPPYLLGEIELPERVVVYSLVTQCSAGELKTGAEMELVTVKAREEARDGKPVTVLAYAFRPR